MLWFSCRSALVFRPRLAPRRPVFRDAEWFPSAAALVRGPVAVRPRAMRSLAVPACAAAFPPVARPRR